MPPSCDHLAIPLFDRTPYHSSVPTDIRAAGARSDGPGRPPGRRLSALPWTGASALALWRRIGMAMGMVTIVATLDAAVSPAAATQTASPPSAVIVPSATAPFTALINEAAQRFGVPALWLRFVMQAESAGDPQAVSPKGAMGLMQIMPETYAELRQSYRLGADPFVPRDNILAGAAYLREMYDRYGAPGFLAAYNAGPARYEDHLATGRPLPDETRFYLARLTPLVAGVQVERIATAPDPLAWTQSALFISRTPNRNAEAGHHTSLAADRPIEKPAAETIIADVTALEPQSAGLFVRLGSAAGPQ